VGGGGGGFFGWGFFFLYWLGFFCGLGGGGGVFWGGWCCVGWGCSFVCFLFFLLFSLGGGAVCCFCLLFCGCVFFFFLAFFWGVCFVWWVFFVFCTTQTNQKNGGGVAARTPNRHDPASALLSRNRGLFVEFDDGDHGHAKRRIFQQRNDSFVIFASASRSACGTATSRSHRNSRAKRSRAASCARGIAARRR